MKSIKTFTGVASLLVATFAMAQTTTNFQAQNSEAKNGYHTRYVVTDLGTLPNGNGVFDDPYWIVNNGVAAGWVSLTGGTSHAVLWREGMITDLGTLGGPNSYAYGVNERVRASGIAETGISDPNGEDYCGFGTHLICLGFVWQNGAMTALSTLGGNNSQGSQINSRGEVVGYAENATPDPTCPIPQKFAFKPVIWEADGAIRALAMVQGDSEGAAFGINESGEAVGTSGTCGAFNADFVYLTEAHAVSWKNGTATDLGNLGGTGAGAFGNAAYSANSRGDVVGHSALPGGLTEHAFLWTKRTGMQDLGTLPGDAISYALGINDSGVIVGTSWVTATFTGPHATIWDDGVPTNLNTLVVPGGSAGLYLGQCQSVNNRGEIVGWGIAGDGGTHAFLATPVHGADSLPLSPAGNPPLPSDEARKQLQRMIRFARGMMPRQ